MRFLGQRPTDTARSVLFCSTARIAAVAMDFTSLYSSTSSILSPSSSLLLTATSGFLVLRDAASFQVLQSWRTGSPSSKPWTQLSFSADSRFCLASDTEAGIVEVYAVDEEKAVVSVKAGSEGLMGVRWLEGSSGGPRLIACWARHGVRHLCDKWSFSH